MKTLNKKTAIIINKLWKKFEQINITPSSISPRSNKLDFDIELKNGDDFLAFKYAVGDLEFSAGIEGFIIAGHQMQNEVRSDSCVVYC